LLKFKGGGKMFKKKGKKQQEKAAPPSAKKRVVRFFISSTFRDMQEERDVLIKKVFPRLQQQFRWSGVEIIPIDLRWGVTREQAENGAVLPICLAEIDQCQPYFIGLLGDRYGWIPDTIPQELLDAYPWLDKYRDRSLTELEIIHGVLNDPKNQDRAFFFLRKPDDPPAGAGGKSQAENEEGPREKIKLQALKERIFDSGCDFVDYKDPGELVLQAYEILEAALSDEFPEQKPADPFAQEARAHQIHAQPYETIHVMRQELVSQLDDYVERGGAPLMVLGGTGSGKTALLSNYCRHRAETHPDEFILLHFMGILQQNSIAGFIYRVAGELQKRFGLKGVLPGTDEQARLAFPRWLEEASAKGRVLLLVDDVDQLGYQDQKQNFSWIPAALPANARLICTAKPEHVPEAMRSGAASVIQLPPLTKNEREQIIANHFKVYGKKLEPQYVSALAAAPQTALPLFLAIALNELRVYGYFEKLDEHITHLLTSEHLLDLYHRVLGRFEQDFGGHRPQIVKEFMSLVYYSRHGMAEDDLEYCLKLDKADALFTWHALLLAASGIMKSWHGRLFIGDKFLENAIWERYIKNSAKAEHYHGLLADCFTKQQMTAADMSELFWHLFSLKDWQRLHDILADLDFIRSEIRSHALFHEIMGYWLVLEHYSGFRMKTTYQDVLDNPGKDPELHGFINDLLDDPALKLVGVDFAKGLIKQPDPLFRNQFDLDPGIMINKNKDGTTTIESIGSTKHSVANSFFQEMTEHGNLGMQAINLLNKGDLKGAMDTAMLQAQLCRKRGDKSNLVTSLIVQGSILRMQGSLDAALPLLQEAEQICLESKNRLSLHLVYAEQGLVFLAGNQLDKAMPLFQEQEKLCRERSNESGQQEAIRNQGLVMLARHAPEEALKLFQEQEKICRKIANKPGLRFSLEKQAEIEFFRQRRSEAIEVYRKLEVLCRELDDLAGLQLALGRRAELLFNSGNVEAAFPLWSEQEAILRNFNDPNNMQITLGNLGLAWEARKNLPEAAKKYQEQESICRQHRIRFGLQYSLDRQANIFYAAKEYEKAAALWQEQESICRELKDMAKAQGAVGNQGLAMLARHAPDDALKLFQEQEKICRQIANKPGIRFSLEKQAEIEFSRQRWPEARELYRKLEVLCREITDPGCLQLALGRQGNILFNGGNADAAFLLWSAQEEVLRDLNDPNNMQITLGNLGVIWEARKNFPEAMKKYQEQESVCRQHRILPGLQYSLDKQANLFFAAKQYDKAAVLWQEQEKICRELKDMRKVQWAVSNQGRVLFDQNDPTAALPFFKEQERICRELKDDNFLSLSLFNQAVSLQKLNEPEQALPLMEEAQRLFARINNAQMNNRAIQLLPVIKKSIEEKAKP
jgi:tetratricopeptide (TPR) repeat protein